MPAADSQAFRDRVAAQLGGAKLLLVGGPVAGLTPLVRQVRALGAARPLVLASETGTGELPGDDEAECLSLDVRDRDVTAAVRAYEARLGDLPDAARTAVERFDPTGEALAQRPDASVAHARIPGP